MQTQIYDFIGFESDPIFREINKLSIGQAVDLGGVTVKLNKNGLYEVESLMSHECFQSKKQVYDNVAKIISLSL